jgi:putative ABC transport system permease protein
MRLLRRLWAMLRVRRLEEDLSDELQFHREMKEQELQRAGLSATQARLAARAALGNATRSREDARAIWLWPWLESAWQDVVYATRSLRRQPGFTLVAICALGVSIGLNSSLFTVFAGLALRPMAGLGDPASVVSVSAESVLGRGGAIGFSYPEFRFLADGARTFDGLVAHRAISVSLESERVGRTTPAYVVSGNYFDVLGIRMAHGRGFLASEDRRESPARVAVLSYQLWRNRFGEAIVGSQIRIDGIPHTVVGITPPEFSGPEGTPNRVWLPIASLPSLRPNDPYLASLLDRWQDCCVNVTGRLTEDATRAEARAELQVLSQRFRGSVGQDPRNVLIGGTQFLSGRNAKGAALAIIAVLFTGITLLLLIACANVGNLLLDRAAARMAEIGVRLSIGASRSRIVRQLLTEGLVLASVAAAAGLALATWLPPFVLDRVANQPAPFDIAPDALVIGYAVALAVLTCVACSLAPALHVTRVDVASALKDGTPALRSRFPLRTVLLATQVAVTVVLLTSAGLLLRGVAQAREFDVGFNVEGIGVAKIELPAFAYDNTRAAALLNDLRTAVRNAGLQSFAFVGHEPLADLHFQTGVRLDGQSEDLTRIVQFINVTPGYFSVLGLPMIAGRDFQESEDGRPLAIVNETFARQYWPGQNPVGRTFVSGRESFEIVGLVKDAYLSGLNGIEPLFFRPMGAQVLSELFPTLMFRATGPAAWTSVAALISNVEPRARVDVAPLRDRFENRLAQLNFAPLAASILGVLGLTLATIGMFGVFAYVVRQRTKEIGIRMALGAPPVTIVRLVLSGNSRAITVGLAAGLAGALAASQVLRGSLYGLSPLDPIAYGGVVLLLATAALIASYLPARRATRIDPVLALRHE